MSNFIADKLDHDTIREHEIISDIDCILGEMSDYIYSTQIDEHGTMKTEWIKGALTQLTGYTFDEIKQMEYGFSSLIHPENIQNMLKTRPKLLENKPQVVEYQITRKDGKRVWLKDFIHPVFDPSQERVTRLIGGIQNITEHKELFEQMKRSNEMLEKIFDCQLDAIFILNTKMPPTIVNCNHTAEKVFGYSKEEIVGRSTEFLHLSPDTLKSFQEQLYPAISSANSFHLPVFQMRRKNGKAFYTEHTVMEIKGSEQERIGWLSIVRDIDEKRKSTNELKQMALTDELTGIYNRRAFYDMYQRDFRRYQRHKEPFSLVMIDIDHFKSVNDSFGHLAGDEILKAVSQKLSKQLRTSDYLGRLGGEEFAIILHNTTGTDAENTVQRLINSIKELRVTFEGKSLSVTISAGIASANNTYATEDKLMSHADSLLYKAKEAGRDRYAC